MDSKSNRVELINLIIHFIGLVQNLELDFICNSIFNRFFINIYLPFPVFIKILMVILDCFLNKIGKNFFIKPKVNIKYP